MPTINRNKLYEKILGCWIGKSIGGTLGTPFEGKRELLDVKDFTSKSGQPLPNDDLDLQLIWLKALEDCGPLGVNASVLGEYWISYIPPHWNEYGIGKSNMKAGLLPPMSGDYDNPWKHSNGAWIRSEIWACCTPGCPELAAKYSFYDASADHGTGEGTYAELFTSALESAAFIESDRNRLINIGLSYIPSDCRVAKSINIALDGYKKGLDWKETRNLVLEDSGDLGWFQAPANVAFVIIGWLYGEGDFKKSLLTAVNCGDDTDCTAATLGSILGIINGAEKLPKDWKNHVGDNIITMAIDRGSWWNIPETCTGLTDRVMSMALQMLAANRTNVIISDKETSIGEADINRLTASDKYIEKLKNMNNALCFDFIHSSAELFYKDGVGVKAEQEISLEITIKNKLYDPRHLEVTYILPNGFTLVQGEKRITLSNQTDRTNGSVTFTVTYKAGNEVQSENRGIIQIVAQNRPTVILIPILFFGK